MRVNTIRSLALFLAVLALAGRPLMAEIIFIGESCTVEDGDGGDAVTDNFASAPQTSTTLSNGPNFSCTFARDSLGSVMPWTFSATGNDDGIFVFQDLIECVPEPNTLYIVGPCSYSVELNLAPGGFGLAGYAVTYDNGDVDSGSGQGLRSTFYNSIDIPPTIRPGYDATSGYGTVAFSDGDYFITGGTYIDIDFSIDLGTTTVQSGGDTAALLDPFLPNGLTISEMTVPEPSSSVLLAVGVAVIAGLGCLRRNPAAR